MSELYKDRMNAEVINVAVQHILDNASPDKPLGELLAAQLAQTFEDGLRVGLNLRCNEMVIEIPKINEGHDVLQAIHHSDGCLLQAQRICYNVIPGIIELPELIADYGHKAFAAGFDRGYEEGFTDGSPDDEEETT